MYELLTQLYKFPYEMFCAVAVISDLLQGRKASQ